MKKIVVSLCFIMSMVMCGALVAQDNDTKIIKPTDRPILLQKLDTVRTPDWVNPIERFVGVWSLERTIVDADGKEKKVYPGTFMVVSPNASYTIFVATDVGAVITSQGVVIIDSPDVLVEVISHHVNSSLVGVSNRIDYTIDFNYLHKSFWIEKDKYGDDYERQVNETWKRGKMPIPGEFDNGEGFPI